MQVLSKRVKKLTVARLRKIKGASGVVLYIEEMNFLLQLPWPLNNPPCEQYFVDSIDSIEQLRQLVQTGDTLRDEFNLAKAHKEQFASTILLLSQIRSETRNEIRRILARARSAP